MMAGAKKAEVVLEPRPCRWCKQEFTPKRKQDVRSEFCSKEHRVEFWKKAQKQGAAAMTGNLVPAPSVPCLPLGEPVQQSVPITDKQAVLELLTKHAGEWVDHPYHRLRVMWHSRVADLRKMGHQIENRRVWDGRKFDYQYKLTVSEAVTA